MGLRAALAAVGLAMLTLAPAALDAQSRLMPAEAEVLQDGLVVTADAFVLPAYTDLAAATDALAQSLSGYCTDGAALAPAQAAFADTFLAWQRASIIHIGPVTEAEGPMRVQLWPDPKGFAQRAVRRAVRAEDPALIAPGGLVGRSIALTNLTALEHLLYGPLAPDTYACALAYAIAAFQAELAHDLETAWTPGSDFRVAFDGALAGNARYPSVDAVVRELLAGTVVYVDRMRKFKLLRGLGTAPGEARPERTEARQSGLGLASLEAAFRALADLYDVPFGVFDAAPNIGGSMAYFVLAQSARGIADALSVETATLAEIAAEDGAAAAELRGHADFLLRHESFLKSGFTSSVGLTSGFTAADGD